MTLTARLFFPGLVIGAALALSLSAQATSLDAEPSENQGHDAAQAGGELLQPPKEVCEQTARHYDSSAAFGKMSDTMWAALLRLVADQEQDYAR